MAERVPPDSIHSHRPRLGSGAAPESSRAAPLVPSRGPLSARSSSLAGLGLWLRDPRAPAAIVALGCAFAATRLIDAFVLGIRPWLFALLAALAALVAAPLLAAWTRSDTHRPT